jgi:hypothetical protein
MLANRHVCVAVKFFLQKKTVVANEIVGFGGLNF